MQDAGSEKYEQSYKFIDENLKNGKNVLVHCAAGACRSVGICIFFLMKKNGWSLEQTHTKLKKIRSEVADLNEDSLSKYIKEIVEHFSKID
jgi:protein-tyrosine phosphatase